MKHLNTLVLIVLTVGMLLSACAPSAQGNAADRFTGMWLGSMSFTDREAKEEVFVTIPGGCAVGEVCGEIFNSAVNCVWEVRLEGINGDVFEYAFSKTLSGECPALGSGTLTLKADGTLVREHVTPDFTSIGTLSRQAEGYQPMYGFAGKWSGEMSFSDDPDRTTVIEIAIPASCKAGNTCGGIIDYSGKCGISMTLKNINGGIFEYELPTNTIVECPYGGGGVLTLQPDGSLIMEHTSPNQTMSAVLLRQ
jgi:hypothetical protein